MRQKLRHIIIVLLLASSLSQAAVTILMEQVGGNVVATLSGAINSLPGAPTASGNLGSFSGVRPSGPTMAFGLSQYPGVSLVAVNYYTATSVPNNFGTGTNLLQATSSTAPTTMMFRNLSSNNIMIDQTYVLGTAVTGTMTWASQTLSSMGVTPGTYVWGWTGDSVTLNVVPEPSALSLLVAGFGGLAILRRRRD